MSYRVCIDTFTSLDDLKPKQRRDPEAVLEALRHVSRISVWDHDNRVLSATITDLERRGLIVTDNTVPYPWIGVRVVSPEPANG